MNPSHKQKKSQEPDVPQWYIDACIDAMTQGLGVVVIRFDGQGYEAEHIPPARYKQMAEALVWSTVNAANKNDTLHKPRS